MLLALEGSALWKVLIATGKGELSVGIGRFWGHPALRRFSMEKSSFSSESPKLDTTSNCVDTLKD